MLADVSALKSLVDRRFGAVVVVEQAEPALDGATRWRVRCDCGANVVVIGKNLKSDRVHSCGCRIDLPGGGAAGHEKTYDSWQGMIRRCTDPHAEGYPYYGGRGIKVCERWMASFRNFLADMGDRPSGRTLDRKDSNKNYEPGNCRWATRVEQSRNRRSAKLSSSDVLEILGRHDHGEGISSIRRRFTVTDTHIRDVVNGDAWADHQQGDL